MISLAACGPSFLSCFSAFSLILYSQLTSGFDWRIKPSGFPRRIGSVIVVFEILQVLLDRFQGVELLAAPSTLRQQGEPLFEVWRQWEGEQVSS
jgi:hypothetical protein